MNKYIKKAGKVFAVETPIGDLEWVVISGEGTFNKLKGENQFQATVVLDPATQECKDFIEEIEQFWKDNRPKKFATKDATSTGFRPHTVKSEEVDEDGEPVYKEDGLIAFQFKTGTTYQDGKPKKIPVYNAKGNAVALGDKKIGNGSRGRLQGVIAIYEQPKTAGSSLYLNAVQLSKYVPYVGGPNFKAIDEAGDDAFEGFEEDLQEEASQTSETTSKPTPRL